MMFASLPDDADSYFALPKAVDRRSSAFTWTSATSCRAKDLRIAAFRSLQFVEVVPGRGLVDYKAYLRNLAQTPLEGPLMMKRFANDGEYQEGARYIRKQGAQVGVSFV